MASYFHLCGSAARPDWAWGAIANFADKRIGQAVTPVG
jgi:hypothetical protein